MKIHQVYTESVLDNFTYLLELSDGSAIAIDPWDEVITNQLLADNSLSLKAIINTHEHWDHTCGNKELVQKTGCEVWAHSGAKGKIEGVNRYLNKDEKIDLGGGKCFLVMDTPGHTHAHLCMLLKESDKPVAVFTGDTMFNAGVGNCHNGGDPEILYETIKEQFLDLPDEVKVYPGHEYLGNNLKFTLDREPTNEKAQKLLEDYDENTRMVTNMSIERKINTFLRLNQNEIINNLEGDTSSEKEVFLRLRELRNHW